MPIDPFKDTPNLFELIGQDEQLKEAGQSIEDFLKGAILGNTTDLVGAPVQILGDALNALGVPVGTKPVGGTNWLREQLGQAQPENESLAQTLGSLVGMPDPQSATTALGLLGAIRKGGNPELFAWHNSNINSLADNILTGEGVLSNPSIGISKFNPFMFGGTEDPSLLFRPTEHLDPSKTRAHFYNRDAYTTRDRSNVVQSLDDLRFTEMAAPKESSHLLSIAASPNFKSPEEFELSPAGAGALIDPRQKDYVSDTYDSIAERLQQSAYGNEFVPQTAVGRQAWALDVIEQLKSNPDPTGLGQELLRILQTSPSEYAELKKAGDLPLNSDTLGGILLHPAAFYGMEDQPQHVARLLEDKLGVPVNTAKNLVTSSEWENLAKMATYLASQVERRDGRPFLSDEGRKMWGRIEEKPATRALLPYEIRESKEMSKDELEERFLTSILYSPWLATMKARQLTKE